MRRTPSRAAVLVRLLCFTAAAVVCAPPMGGWGSRFTPLMAYARQAAAAVAVPAGHTAYQATVGGRKTLFAIEWKPGQKKVNGFYAFLDAPKQRYALKGEMFKDGQLSLTQIAPEGQATLWLTRQVVGKRETWKGKMFAVNGARPEVVLERTLGKG